MSCDWLAFGSEQIEACSTVRPRTHIPTLAPNGPFMYNMDATPFDPRKYNRHATSQKTFMYSIYDRSSYWLLQLNQNHPATRIKNQGVRRRRIGKAVALHPNVSGNRKQFTA